ncbi:MAG: ABC transporter substrate-binding protein [Acidimicrobiia bacterium]|nr:ABC transporter substrate-binding protein [Acidimicrobiia bacterium]
MQELREAGNGAARKRLLRPLALIVVAGLVAAACGGGRDDDKADDTSVTTAAGGSTTTGTGEAPTGEPIIDASNCPSDPTTGIDGDTIKLGTSLPQSGLYSAFAEILKGEEAYFSYLNEELGGVDVAGTKYKIKLVNKDDEYLADKTVANVNSLINDDKVFALFNVIGTKNNLAIRDLVNEQCVPNLFAGTGSPAWGNTDYPFVLGSELVPYPLEMKAFADHLAETKPGATVAILRASDDFGRAYSDTFESLAADAGLEVVKEETYNPEQFDTKSQVTSLAATDADALILGTTLLACPDALKNVDAAGWKPIIYMSGTCTSKTLMDMAGPPGDGVLSVGPLMDPANPMYADHEAMKLFKEMIAKYQPEADPTNGIVAYGWTTGALMAELLQRSPAADRIAVMETARTMSTIEGIGLMLDGQVHNLSADDWFLGETFHLVQYSTADGYFSPIGELINEDGNTASYTPDDLLNG